MYRTFVAALLCALFVVPIASARGLTPDLSTQLDAQLQANRERYGIAGQAVLVAHDGQVLYQGASGERDPATHAPATVDSIFAAQSMAKLLTSTLVMQLVDQGKLDLDAPASRYVPDLPTAWQAIRVRDFLNHSSGIAEYYDRVDNRWVSKGYAGVAPDLAAALKVAAAAPMQFATGSRVQYTQANYLVLTALLEAHYRRPYPAIARERILQPLKMASTSWGVASVPAQRAAVPYIGKDGQLQPANEDPWPDYGWGHADLQTSVGDMNRFLQALATGRLLRDPGKTRAAAETERWRQQFLLHWLGHHPQRRLHPGRPRWGHPRQGAAGLQGHAGQRLLGVRVPDQRQCPQRLVQHAGGEHDGCGCAEDVSACGAVRTFDRLRAG
jgi:D-alanyl-D-alanine carboxypeptidase